MTYEHIQETIINLGIGKIVRKRLFFCLSIMSWVLIAVGALYFRFFPTIINPVISDTLIVSVIFLLLLSLIIGSFMVKHLKELILIMPQCLLICFLARCIRSLRLSYPALWDPYAFYVTFLNIHDYGTLEPVYNYWYPVEGLINWPSMLIITEYLSNISGIDTLWLFRYQQPILGMILFLGIFLLAYMVSRNYGVALLSALISSLSSHVIFYQSEYHYQGYAFIIFVFLLISLMKLFNSRNVRLYRVLVVIFTLACTFSHYYSSLFVLFILGLSFCFVHLISIFNKVCPNIRLNLIKVNQQNNAFLLLLILLIIGYHLFVFPEHIQSYVQMISTANPYHAPVISAASSIPFPTNIIHNIRFIILLLGFVSILYTIKTKKNEELILAIICTILISLGAFGNTLFYLEVGRIVAFYELLIGIFVALTLFRLRDIWLKPLDKQRTVTTLICIIIAGIITITFFGGHYVPAYYFKSLDQNSYYWCNNNLPDMQKYENGGLWINRYTPENSLILTDGTSYFIHSAIFFWGQVPQDRIMGLNYNRLNLREDTFTASNIKGDPISRNKQLIKQTSKTYFNGEFKITTV